MGLAQGRGAYADRAIDADGWVFARRQAPVLLPAAEARQHPDLSAELAQSRGRAESLRCDGASVSVRLRLGGPLLGEWTVSGVRRVWARRCRGLRRGLRADCAAKAIPAVGR